jgi:hypothetical protein
VCGLRARVEEGDEKTNGHRTDAMSLKRDIDAPPFATRITTRGQLLTQCFMSIRTNTAFSSYISKISAVYNYKTTIRLDRVIFV